jgi:hypothetical protein
MPQPYDANRDDIAEAVMGQNKGGALGYGLGGLASAMPANMPTAMPTGMPQTPAGGVPGSGLAPAAPSNMALPPQQPMPMQPRAQGMGTMPELSQIPWQGGGGMPQGMPQMGGIGAMPQGELRGMYHKRRAY